MYCAIWRETLVVGKFGELSAKLRTFGRINFGEYLYGSHPIQLSSGVVWPIYIFYVHIVTISSS